MKIALNIILIQFRLVLKGMWCDGRRSALTRKNPKKIQTCRRQNQRATNETRKKGLKIYADMTIHAIDPARLTMCHHQLPTTSH